MPEYSVDEFCAIYELGRLYFEMGYLVPAERIFSGLSCVDGGKTPSRLGLGLVKLERGLLQEASEQFRAVLQAGECEIEAKIGLCACSISSGELSRAKSILGELAKVVDKHDISQDIRKLFESMILRCREG